MKSYLKFNILGLSALLLAVSLAISACTTEVEVIREVPGETVTVTKEVPVEVIKEVYRDKEGAVRTREVEGEVVKEVIKEVPGETKTVTVTKEIQVSVPVAADLPAASKIP